MSTLLDSKITAGVHATDQWHLQRPELLQQWDNQYATAEGSKILWREIYETKTEEGIRDLIRRACTE